MEEKARAEGEAAGVGAIVRDLRAEVRPGDNVSLSI